MPNRISAGVGERMQYLAHQYNDTTVRFVLRYPGMLNAGILCAAARAIVESVDVLHASFIANAQTCHWQVNGDYRTSDFFTLISCDGDPVKVASHWALSPVRHLDPCQFQVALVQGTDECAVALRMSHLVVDGGDGKYLLGKLAEGYRLMEQQGDTSALEIKNGDRSAMNAYKDLGLQELSSLIRKPFDGVKTNFSFANPGENGPLRLLRCTIPAELLGQARIKAKSAGASVNDLILTGCYRSLAKCMDQEGAMSIAGMMDLRQHCKDGVSEGLANMSGGLSTTLEYKKESTFAQNLEELSRQTRMSKEDPLAGLGGIPVIHAATKTAPMWILLKAANFVYADVSLSMTNLGNIPCEPLSMGGLKPSEGIFGGPLKRKPAVQVCAASFDGTAELAILGDFAERDLEPLQNFLNGIREELEQYLES